jgi:phosphoribosyl-dephospho-CoA transferase
MSWQRHSLCHLKKQSEPLRAQAPQDFAFFRQWINNEFPLVFTRQPDDLQDDQCQLAIPFINPMTLKKERFSFIVNTTDVEQVSDLPDLSEIHQQWQNKDCSIKVFGSYCWQYLTRMPYVQNSSDLDLLITYTNMSLNQLAALHESLQLTLETPQIDCELRFSKLGDCALSELLEPSQGKKILFKSATEVVLLQRERVYENYPTLLG